MDEASLVGDSVIVGNPQQNTKNRYFRR